MVCSETNTASLGWTMMGRFPIGESCTVTAPNQQMRTTIILIEIDSDSEGNHLLKQ